jgi:superoxide dismutase, Cu-Zn family
VSHFMKLQALLRVSFWVPCTGAIAVALLTGCAPASLRAPAPSAAQAELKPTQGHSASGLVRFSQQGDQVTVVARVSGLKPGLEHGFHLHEKGDCSSPDASSAGGHFNPSGKPHGPPGTERHAGDLPSLKADASGTAEATFRVSGLSIGSGPADIVGRGLIVHAQPDDYQTQPTGNSGARIACAVVTPA